MLTSSIYVIGIVVEIIRYTKLILHTTLEFEMSDLITDIICSGQKDWSDAPNWKVFCGVRMHPYSLISILFLVYILRIEWKAIVHKVVFIVMSFFVWPAALRYMSICCFLKKTVEKEDIALHVLKKVIVSAAGFLKFTNYFILNTL